MADPRERVDGGIVSLREAVQVLLGRDDAAVAEPLLNDLDVRAAGQKP